MRTRPGGLTAVCVIAIVLGCLGLISVLGRITTLVASSRLNEAMIKHMPEEQRELQKELVAKTNAVTARWKPVLYLICLAQFAIAGSLLGGAIMTFNWNPSGRKWLAGTMFAGIAFELIKALPEGMILLENQAVSKEYMGKLMAAQPNAAGAEAMGDAIASVTMFVAFAFMIVWALAKIIYYAIGARTLRKPELDPLFVPEPQM